MLANVLVVDDDPEMRKVLTSILEDEGYTVENAENGNQAIKICKKLPFDVALIDIELPDMKVEDQRRSLLLHPLLYRMPGESMRQLPQIVAAGDRNGQRAQLPGRKRNLPNAAPGVLMTVDEAPERLKMLAGYQINAAVVEQAKPGALVMHCLPAYRGKEIDEATFEANADTIFRRSCAGAGE
jgi:CheY-like chemotaxis protein